MPRKNIAPLDRSVYKRRQPPARYMATGELRPCYICKKAERVGCTLWAYVRETPVAKYLRVDGQWRVDMQQLPDGEVVPVRYIRTQATNYHAECEREKARELRLAQPNRTTKLERLKEGIEQLREEIALLRVQQRQSGSGSGSVNKQERVSARQELHRAAQTSPGFAGSGIGERVRNRVNRPKGWDWLLDHSASGHENMVVNKDWERLMAERAALQGMQAKPESGSDPVSSDTPVAKPKRDRSKGWEPAPLGYDPNEPLGEETT